MPRSDEDYLTARAAAERELAAKAATPETARIHEELALAYEARAQCKAERPVLRMAFPPNDDAKLR